VKMTRYWHGVSMARVVSNDPFEELRDLYFARLHIEQTRLTQLATALVCAEGHPADEFAEIKLFAHRLRGGAAIFEAPEVGMAADALERAAALASAEHALSSDPSVRMALDSLLDRLTIVNRRHESLAPAKNIRSHYGAKAKMP
jgi:chemotaxis protein histidine kinase CheA